MSTVQVTSGVRLTLQAQTAGDLMSSNPISLRREASVQEAVALMLDRNFDATPVIDEKGRAIGVVTITDILVHDREYVRYLKTGDTTYRSDLEVHDKMPAEFGIEVVDRTPVEDIMTPIVFTVDLETPAWEVVQKLISLKVHHLFVRDEEGTLVGVISTGDILRHLQ
jgi:CBS-domain-containing membrane protein